MIETERLRLRPPSLRARRRHIAARRELRLDLLTAFAHPDNAASRRVLQKLGFAVERFVPEKHRYRYRCPLAPN